MIMMSFFKSGLLIFANPKFEKGEHKREFKSEIRQEQLLASFLRYGREICPLRIGHGFSHRRDHLFL